MKKTWIILLLILVAGLISCTDEIVINETEIDCDLLYTENHLVPFSGKCKVVYGHTETAKEILTYRKGRLDGDAHYYYRNGNIKWKGFYKNGFISGKWEYWDENGILTYIVNYRHDTLDGEYVSYYPDGGIKEQGYYVNNSRTGEWTVYSENGKVTSKEIY
ncbi:MAG: toxin-antitoxin system YwqK family antitoxin [Bacteroidales bacterium]|nr:toxin-antitoxin system YwqK family antitoxin [Bacteroidales bacterium]